MRGAFDDEIDQRNSSHDAEFTLGPGTMLLLSAGLVIVCGVCFGMGYMVGHRSAAPQAVVRQTESAPANPQANSSLQKPRATAQAAVPAATQPTSQTDNIPQSAASNVPSTPAASVPVSSAQEATQSTVQMQVRPALPAAASAPQPAPAYPSHPAYSPQQAQYGVRPAPKLPAVALWVQIAAVSHIEDAQVLTTALRKRGYTVTPRREADNLIHVRIGPFSTSEEASRWRAKLLDDGYNAEVQQ